MGARPLGFKAIASRRLHRNDAVFHTRAIFSARDKLPARPSSSCTMWLRRRGVLPRPDWMVVQFDTSGMSEDVAAPIRGRGTEILAGHGSIVPMTAELTPCAGDGETGLDGLAAVMLLGVDAAASGVSATCGHPTLLAGDPLVGAPDGGVPSSDHQVSLVAPDFAPAGLPMVASLTPALAVKLLLDGEAWEPFLRRLCRPDRERRGHAAQHCFNALPACRPRR